MTTRRTYRKRNAIRREKDLTTGENNQTETNKFWKDAALILGFISLLGYISAFSFNIGFSSFYQLDESLINDISISNLMEVSINVVKTFFLGLIIYWLSEIFIPRESTNIYIRFFRSELFFVNFMLLTAMLSIGDPLAIKVAGWVILIFNTFSFIFVFVVHFKVKGFKSKLNVYLDEQGNTLQGMIQGIKKSNFKKIAIFIFLVSFLASVSNMAGHRKAEIKEDYLVIHQEKNHFVLINKFNDSFIVAPVSLQGIMETKFILIDIKSDINKPIKLERYKFKNGLKIE